MEQTSSEFGGCASGRQFVSSVSNTAGNSRDKARDDAARFLRGIKEAWRLLILKMLSMEDVILSRCEESFFRVQNYGESRKGQMGPRRIFLCDELKGELYYVGRLCYYHRSYY